MQPPRSAQGFAQARKADPLLGAFPLAVMTFAIFLVLFTLTIARLKAGADPALRPSTSLVARSSGARAVTRARWRSRSQLAMIVRKSRLYGSSSSPAIPS
jgi:hypothetical protein